MTTEIKCFEEWHELSLQRQWELFKELRSSVVKRDQTLPPNDAISGLVALIAVYPHVGALGTAVAEIERLQARVKELEYPTLDAPMPTEPGWYRWQKNPFVPMCVELFECLGKLCMDKAISGCMIPVVAEIGGRWSMRIPMPDEPGRPRPGDQPRRGRPQE